MSQQLNINSSHPIDLLSRVSHRTEQQSVPLHQPILKPSSSSRSSLMQSPPAIGRVELSENVLESILGAYNPNETISAPATPQLSTELMNILNNVSTSSVCPLPSAATTTATPTLTRTVESSTSPLSSQPSGSEVKAIVDAVTFMTTSICDSINRQTNQFSMLRATISSYLKQAEEHGKEVSSAEGRNRGAESRFHGTESRNSRDRHTEGRRQPYSPTPLRRRQPVSEVYIPTKKRRTDNKLI